MDTPEVISPTLLENLHKKQEAFFFKEALELYIPPQVGRHVGDKEPPQDAAQAIGHWLNNPEKQCLLLLGDSGAGKTLFGQWITRQSFQQGLQERIPLFIALLAQDRPDKFLIDDYLRDICGIKEESQREWIKQQPLLLILDGFDEVKFQDNVKINLYRSNKLWQLRDVKIIITCRSQALEQIHDYHSLFCPCDSHCKPQLDQLQEYVVTPFSEENIEAYIKKYVEIRKNGIAGIFKAAEASSTILHHNWGALGNQETTRTFLNYLDEKSLSNAGQVSKGWRYSRLQKQVEDSAKWMYWQTYDEYIQRLPGLKTLLTSPFVLSIVVQVLPSIIAQHEGKEKIEQLHLARINLYDHFVKQWFTRQRKKLLEAGHISDNCPIEELFTKCSKSIANAMLQAKVPSIELIPHKVMPFLEGQGFFDSAKPDLQIERENTGLKYVDEEISVNREKIKLSLILSGCPVMQIQQNQYAFLHKSLLEYFAARKLFEGVMADASIALGYELNDRLLVDEPETLKFLAERVEQDAKLKQRLFDVLEESKFDERVEVAAANAITVLNYAGVSFSQKPLKRIRIKGADLSNAILDSTDLRDADLRGVNLRRAWLNHAKLGGSLMQKVEFGELPYLDVEEAVTCIAYSPDGRFLVTGSECGTIQFLKYATGECIATLKAHTEIVTSIAFSPDGLCLASGGVDKTVRLLDVKTRHWLAVLPEHTAAVTSVAFSPDGLILASGSSNDLGSDSSNNHNSVSLWDVKKYNLLGMLSGHANVVNSISFSPDGSILASGGRGSDSSGDNIDDIEDGDSVHLWDVKTREILCVLRGHSFYVLSIVFSPDGLCIASGGFDESIRLWDVKTRTKLGVLKGHTGWIKSLAFSPDGLVLASGSNDMTVRLWDVKKLTALDVLRGHTAWVQGVAFSSGGSVLASGSGYSGIIGIGKAINFPNLSNDNSVRFWDVKKLTALDVLRGHTALVHAVAFSPDGSILASGSSNTVHLWDVKTRTKLCVLNGHTGMVNSLAFNPDGLCLASGSSNTVHLWDVKTRARLCVLNGHTDIVNSLAFSPDGSVLVAGGLDAVRLWDVKTRTKLDVFNGYTGVVTSFTFSRDGSCIAFGNKDGSVHLWDIKTCTVLGILQGHISHVCSIDFSPDGLCIASGGWDKSIHLWDVKTRTKLGVLNGHTWINSLAFSPDGSVLATGGLDAVRLWDVKTRQCVSSLKLKSRVLVFKEEVKTKKMYLCIYENIAIYMFEIKKIQSQFEFILLWSIGNASGLMSEQLDLGGVVGLEAQHDRLLKQREAVGTLSTKETKTVLEARNQPVSYDPKEPPRNLFSGQYFIGSAITPGDTLNLMCATGWPNKDILESGIYLFREGTPENVRALVIYDDKESQSFNLTHHSPIKQNIRNLVWGGKATQDGYTIITDKKLKDCIAKRCQRPLLYRGAMVSMVRKKSSVHAFLVVEYIEDNHYMIIQSDFYMELRQKHSKGLISSGQALIEICVKPLSDMEVLREQCVYKSWNVASHQAKQLLSNLEADRVRYIGYLNLGNSALYGDKKHNCLTWCEEHLMNIGIDVSQQQSWFDFFVVHPDSHLPDNSDKKEERLDSKKGYSYSKM